MLNALTLLVALQLVGEVIARATGLPIPGPVIGLLLLLGWLMLRDRMGRPGPARGPGVGLKATATGLLGNLGLLFVPAGVGVITQLDVLARNWLAVAVALVLSTLAGLAVTGWVMQRLAAPEEE